MSRFREKMSLLQGKKSSATSDEAKQHAAPITDSITNPIVDDMTSGGMSGKLAEVSDVQTDHIGARSLLTEDKSVIVTKKLNQELAEITDDPFAEQWNAFGVGLFHNEFGSFLMKRKSYSLTHYHGMHQLVQFQDVAGHLSRFHPHQEHACVPYNILFLDLETTGLGTGTGNIPFMVGLAYMEQDEFVVEQAVIRHAGEERAMLAYLHRLTERFTYLVTYNGKTFDWPLLHSRYVMNGMREEIWQPLHIDLLHPSRALWRNTLESCRLSHIEEMRLGIVREDDLPGAEAPERYFKYLNDRNPAHLFPVYLHNEIDMLSLITLTIRFGYLLSNQNILPFVQHPTEPEEMVRTGLWLEKMGLTTYSEQLYSLAFHVPAAASSTLLLLSMRDKQCGQIERAILLWKKIVEYEQLSSYKNKVEAAIQLAMYYEHSAKQFSISLEYAQLAYQQVHQQLELNRNQKTMQKRLREQLLQIEKRIQRLSKKIGIS